MPSSVLCVPILWEGVGFPYAYFSNASSQCSSFFHGTLSASNGHDAVRVRLFKRFHVNSIELNLGGSRRLRVLFACDHICDHVDVACDHVCDHVYCFCDLAFGLGAYARGVLFGGVKVPALVVLNMFRGVARAKARFINRSSVTRGKNSS